MFGKKKSGFLAVHNENLSFASHDQYGMWQCLESIPLSNILEEEHGVDLFSERFKNLDFPLLIVPDFWFGNVSYPFHSKNKSVIRAFIARKLKAEFSETPEVEDFFSYNIAKSKKGEQELNIHFLQEPKSFELCRRLSQGDFTPVRISSPALLWNQRLKKRFDFFKETGVGLVQLLGRECFLFFYFRGNFLFSRAISLPEYKDDNTAAFEVLNYEMNQSFYHFSQQSKTEVDKILMISKRETDVEQLSRMLGREVSAFNDIPQGSVLSEALEARLGPVAVFKPEEILPPQALPGVSDRITVRELEWKKIHLVGIAIGLVLLIILGLEFGFLNKEQKRESLRLLASETEPTQVIEQYNQALDVMLIDAERLKPMDIIGRLASSLPENVQIDVMNIEIEPSPFLFLSGVIRAYGADDLGVSIRSLLENININFDSSRPLATDDVDIDISGGSPEGGYQDYRISFRLDLT